MITGRDERGTRPDAGGNAPRPADTKPIPGRPGEPGIKAPETSYPTPSPPRPESPRPPGTKSGR